MWCNSIYRTQVSGGKNTKHVTNHIKRVPNKYTLNDNE